MLKSKKCWVYWIHLDKHTDVFSEGYVGITTLGVEKRFKTHQSAFRTSRRKPTRLVISIKKYGSDLRVTTLLEGSQEYCQLIENKLRPSENIGWNHAPGGAATRAGTKNTPEHNRKVADSKRGKKQSPDVLAANRLRGKSQFTFEHPWEHPYCNKDVWATADTIHSWYLANPKAGRRTVGKALGIPSDSVLIPLSKIKEGWVPSEDTAWLTFKSGHLQQEEQPNVT